MKVNMKGFLIGFCVGTFLLFSIAVYKSFEQKLFSIFETRFIEYGLEPRLADEYRYLYMLDPWRKLSMLYLESSFVETWFRNKAEKRISELSEFDGEEYAQERVIINHLTYFSHIPPKLGNSTEKYKFLSPNIREIISQSLKEFESIKNYEVPPLQSAYRDALLLDFLIQIDDVKAGKKRAKDLPRRVDEFPVILAMVNDQVSNPAEMLSRFRYQLLPAYLQQITYVARYQRHCDWELISIYQTLLPYLPQLREYVAELGSTNLFDAGVNGAEIAFKSFEKRCVRERLN